MSKKKKARKCFTCFAIFNSQKLTPPPKKKDLQIQFSLKIYIYAIVP